MRLNKSVIVFKAYYDKPLLVKYRKGTGFAIQCPFSLRNNETSIYNGKRTADG